MQLDGSRLQSPDCNFNAIVNTQMAFGGKLRTFPTDTSTTAQIGVSTMMLNTGNNSSLFARTSQGPVVITGHAAPRDGGSLGVSMSTTSGLTHSQANGALIIGAGLSKAHNTTSISQLSHTTWNLSDYSMAAAAGKLGTTPVPGYPSSILHLGSYDRNPPIHVTCDLVMREDNSIPTTGDPSVHTVNQCTCCPPRCGKPPTLKRTATMVKIHVSGDMSVSTS